MRMMTMDGLQIGRIQIPAAIPAVTDSGRSGRSGRCYGSSDSGVWSLQTRHTLKLKRCGSFWPATLVAGLGTRQLWRSGRPRRRNPLYALSTEAAEASNLVMCFDFDGVVCDSVNESSTAAWKHAKELWPSLALGDSPEPFLEPMRLVRPVVETGWENTLIIRILAEADLVEASQRFQKRPARRRANVASLGGPSLLDEPELSSSAELIENLGIAGLMCKNILGSWERIRDQKIAELQLDVEELIKGFGDVRDRWMAEDLKSWFACNMAYDIVPDVMVEMLSRGAQVFVITTKQKRFAKALLQDFGVELPEANLFALEDGPKTKVLKSLLAKSEYKGKEFHFIEDKLGTLRKVAKDPELNAVQLHLASWGYCTQKDIDVVKAGLLEGISLLNQSDVESLGVSEPWLY